MDVPMNAIHLVHTGFLVLYFFFDLMYSPFMAFSMLYVAYRGFVYDGQEERRSVLLRTIKTAWSVNLLFIGVYIYVLGRATYFNHWEGIIASAQSIFIGCFLWFWINCSWKRVDALQ